MLGMVSGTIDPIVKTLSLIENYIGPRILKARQTLLIEINVKNSKLIYLSLKQYFYLHFIPVNITA